MGICCYVTYMASLFIKTEVRFIMDKARDEVLLKIIRMINGYIVAKDRPGHFDCICNYLEYANNNKHITNEEYEAYLRKVSIG